MSSFLVTDEHLCLLIQAANQSPRIGTFAWYHNGERHELDTTQASMGPVLAMLRDENARSVNYRYGENVRGSYGEMIYRTAYPHGFIPPVWVLKAIDSYAYQCCETEDWEQTEAHAFCDALRHRMISCLPGYADAPTWGYSYAGMTRWTDEQRRSA